MRSGSPLRRLLGRRGRARPPHREPALSVALVALWLHVVGVVVWVGGLVYQAHALLPALAAKFILVVLAIVVAAQRDFAHLPLLRAALTAGGDPGPPLRAIARLDRVVLLLALVIVYLGLAVSRA